MPDAVAATRAGPRAGRLRAESGVVVAAGAVVAGARVGEHLAWAAATAAGGALVAAAVAALLAARPRSSRRRLAGMLCLGVLGAVSMARAVDGLDGVAARSASREDEARVTVRLAADPQGRWTGARVPARLERIGDVRAEGTVLVVAGGAAAERVRLLEAGESAVVTGRFRPLGGGERQWRWRHAGAVFEAHDLVGAGRAAPFLLRAANGLRHRVLAGGESLGATDRALVAGFLVGDDRDLPPRVASDFRAAGLSHLLVVSGANVTLALALVAPLLGRLRLVGRLAGGVAVLVVFCAMTRFEPSVLRAGAMSGLSLLAAFLGRPVAGLRLLALTIAGLVLIDPFLVHSLGFGLSCGASAGILLVAGPVSRALPGPRFVREPLSVTSAAQIGVAPIALPAFGHLPLAALPANLAAAPAAAALSLWGLGAGIVGGLIGRSGPDGTGPAAVLQIPTAALAGWIRLVAGVAARSPVMVGPRPALVATAVAVLWRWRRSSLAARPTFRSDGPGVVGAAVGVGFETEEVVHGQQAGAGQQQGGGGDGVQEVEFEPAAARYAEDAHAPLHLGDDQEELERGQAAPQAGEQSERQADAADEFDRDRGPGQQLR
jgi:competence protein ComEC